MAGASAFSQTNEAQKQLCFLVILVSSSFSLQERNP